LTPPIQPKIHIIGAGWAGLSAAVHASLHGWQVVLYEAAHHPGGRARACEHHGQTYDNGQHLLLGAYTDTLALLGVLGVPMDEVLERHPLHLCDARGQGLRLPRAAKWRAVLQAIVHNQRWHARDRLSFVSWLTSLGLWRLAHAVILTLTGKSWDVSVSKLCALASPRVRRDLVEPLCLAALNTPPQEASGAVFARVLEDAFSNAPQSCDFLLPRVNLSSLLPTPAVAWLKERGASLHFGKRIQSLSELPRLAHEPVIVATSAWQAAHLTLETHPDWSARAQDLCHYPIATVYVSAKAPSTLSHNPDPVVMLETSLQAPAQFAIRTHFKSRHGDVQTSVWALVVSDSRGHEREALIALVLAQAEHDLGLNAPLLESCTIEKRATFAALVGQRRPPMRVGPGLWACGDYVDGPYPSTLEGAVRSGKAVIDALMH
jgi:uncharacterized protein with NAD-binding domain and iron-sulfur cluster